MASPSAFNQFVGRHLGPNDTCVWFDINFRSHDARDGHKLIKNREKCPVYD